MARRYEAYCLADPVFYETPARAERAQLDFAVAQRPAPRGWSRAEVDDWLTYLPDGVRLPPQGWKIHASACSDNAEEILAAVWDYCIPRRIPFKLVRNELWLFLRNDKYADRGSSGKLVTIYPVGDGQLETVLTELGAVLDGRPGPYVLSDLRWRAGPLHVRYGGFAERSVAAPGGAPEPAIEDGDGRLVPDRRGPKFEVPPWVALPDCLRPELDRREESTVEDLPYRIEGALHFSNAGGVYKGVNRATGEEVVLKEARPHAGLTYDGADAVARLGRERDTMERLVDLECVPRVRDYFTLGDHHFLVQDFIDGVRLSSLLVDRCTLTEGTSDDARRAEYTTWALDVYGRVERAVCAVHGRGVVIGDLHPSNVLIRPDGNAVLIDWESAAHVSEQRRSALGAAGFAAPRHRVGFDGDRYALACLRLFVFLPLTALIGLQAGKAEVLAAEIAELFPVPPEFLAEATEVIRGPQTRPRRGRRQDPEAEPAIDDDLAGCRRARDSIAQAIRTSATPAREDRLFPGDPEQFEAGGGLNVAHGAAGVLYALHCTGVARNSVHEEWLVRRALDPGPRTRLGFYDGLHGVAYVLDRLGRRDDALRLVDRCVADHGARWGRFSLDLWGGLSGIGLNLAHFAAATGDSSLEHAARDVAYMVAERLGGEGSVLQISGGDHPRAGLLRGKSGPALMFVRLYEQTGDLGLLDLAAVALRQDLRCCASAADGALHVNEGWRTLPYLGNGSVGIGLVLQDYLLHRRDPEFEAAAEAIRVAARGEFYVQSGLFHGRAGMIAFLSRGHPHDPAGVDPAVAAQVRRLAWHALSYRGHLAFPGDGLLRLSMDLATGSAGVMLALGAAVSGYSAHLPFLGPPRCGGSR